MDGIFFLLIAFSTVYTSIKLSYYADRLSKQTKIGSALIGGLLIASITSVPEFVTSLSAVILDNPTLSFGDILGSNMFNIFVLAIYNMLFINTFKESSRKHIIECLILLIDYIFIILGTHYIFIEYISIILFLMYIIYMIYVIKSDNEEENDSKEEKYIVIKFILTTITLVILSIFLTYQANKISIDYPNFSSSSIGAILLGITTSLPEVVTTFELLKLKNYNMAISNMLGSNIFNFLVLSFTDVFIKVNHIFEYSDIYSMYYLLGGLLISILLSFTFKRKNKVLSIIIIISYLYVWYLQFK